MSKEKCVTRTVIVTKAVATCIDLNTETVEHIDVEIPGHFKTEAALLKALQEGHLEAKLIKVSNVEERPVLYSMPESDFLDAARILPARTPKTTNTNN